MGRLVRGLGIAGMAWAVAGCGGVSVRSAAANVVMLSDSASGMHYQLGVADGALTLTRTGSTASAVSDTALTDGVTGAGYRVGVAHGSLMLEPGAAGANGIGLVDSVTAKGYQLEVARGALSLVAADGGR